MTTTRALAIISFGYWFSALSLGLLLHPYMTLRRMVRDKLLQPLVFLPVVTALSLWISTFALVRLGRIALQLIELNLPASTGFALAFLFWWVVWFLLLWQVVLLYLYIRFSLVFRSSK